jgi:sec-independent protein translocase protein TatA
VGYASSVAGLGVPELLIILVILLLVFGPKRLPGLGRQLGGGLREFKDSITGKDDDDDAARPAALPAASTPPAPPEPVPAPQEQGSGTTTPPRA